MKSLIATGRGWVFGLVILVGVSSLAFAQLGTTVKGAPHKVMEFTEQEVQTALLVQTMNDLGKQNWEVFQVVPVWSITSQNGVTELTPKAYHVFGRRPIENK